MLACPAADPMPSLDAIEATLADLIPHLRFDPATRGRPEVLPSALRWGAVCVSILSGAPTQRAIWRTATGSGLWTYAPVTVTPEAVRQRLIAHGPTVMQEVCAQATTLLSAHWSGDLTLAPFATGGVYALDDTTLDKVAKSLPTADGPERPLAGRLHTVFDVRRQCFQTVIPTALPDENERVAAPDLLATLPRRSLVLMDRGYLSFPLFDAITDDRRFFVTRLSDRVTFTPTHVLTDTREVTDVLGFLGTYRADRSTHRYRLVTIRGTFGTRRYLTNVRKPKKLTPAQLGQLYARRWDIELAFKLLKRELGLHLLWATCWELVLTQIWATLLIAQLVLMLRLQLALRAGVDLFDVSLGVLLRDLPRYVARGEPDVLGAIAARGRYGGMIRPSRRTRLAIPTTLPITPPPKGHRRIQVPRYARKP
jgi:hypothetical protein